MRSSWEARAECCGSCRSSRNLRQFCILSWEQLSLSANEQQQTKILTNYVLNCSNKLYSLAIMLFPNQNNSDPFLSLEANYQPYKLMITVKLILLTVGVLISAQSCSVNIQGLALRRPGITQLQFPPLLNATHRLCFSLNLPQIHEKVYLLRLDYFPYMCLNADNDVLLRWNGTAHTAEVEVNRKCKKVSLKDEEQQAYKLVYEFREGYYFEGIALLSSEFIQQYLPTVLVLFIASYFIQKRVFKQNANPRNKRV